MYPWVKTVLIFTLVAVISPAVRRSVQITDHEYSLMYCTKLIREEHFTAGRPLVIVLPLAEEGPTNKEVGYLIQEQHTSGRWPILVYNGSYQTNRNMYTEIQQHGSYIILISVPCEEGEERISRYMQIIYALFDLDYIKIQNQFCLLFSVRNVVIRYFGTCLINNSQRHITTPWREHTVHVIDCMCNCIAVHKLCSECFEFVRICRKEWYKIWILYLQQIIVLTSTYSTL